MKLGIHVVAFDWPGGPASIADILDDLGGAAETVGADALTVMDHYLQLEDIGMPEDPMLEGYATLGFLAGRTRTVKLHLLVTGTMYRSPGLLAKIVSTLDVVSGGRAVLGLGAGWYEREHRALGVPFPPVAERFERMEETLQIVRQMWSNDDGPYRGRHYQLAETINAPQPLQRPHPPILIGGGGERKTLRLVARYADAWNVLAGPNSPDAGPDAGLRAVRHKVDVLRQHCARESTDVDAIEKTLLYVGPAPTGAQSAAFVDLMAAYSGLGFTKVWVMPEGPDPAGFVAGLADQVIPALAEL